MRSRATLLLVLLAGCAQQAEDPEILARAPCPASAFGDGVCDVRCDIPDPDCGFHVIGHRGAPFRAPENTLRAAILAIEDGANALEIDLCITGDQEVILWHDRDPDDIVSYARQGGFEKLPWIPWLPNLGHPARRPIEELTLDEVRDYYGYARTDGPLVDLVRQGDRDPAAVIPTLAEVTAWARRQPTLAAVYLDIKLGATQPHLVPVMARAIAEATERGVYDVLILSPHESILVAFRDWFRDHRPGHRARVILDSEEPGVLEAAMRLGIFAISTGKPIFRDYGEYLDETRDILARREDEDLGIWPVVGWTFDSEAELTELLELGVDGIMTNQPAELARLWRARRGR